MRLRKFSLLNTNLVVETLRKITNNFVAAKIVKWLSKHTQLQKTISVRHDVVSSPIPQGPLSIEPFWERATSDPPIRWEKWRIQVKLAIVARENITLDTLLQPKPTHVRLLVEPKNEMAIEDATEQTDRDGQIRNSQLKLQWELNCQKITEADVLCSERQWWLCDQKCVSLLNLSIGTEGRRLLTEKFPHDNIYDLSTLKLWEMMETAFIRPRNITLDSYVFFSWKQKKGETAEQFYSNMKELAIIEISKVERK